MPDDIHRMHEVSVSQDAALLDALVAAVAGLSRGRARRAIRAGLVTVDGDVQLEEREALRAGALIRCDLRQGIPSKGALKHGRSAGPSDAPPFTILHQDEHLIVVDKAPGVLAAPDPSDRGRPHVAQLLRQQAQRQKRALRFLGAVHRIDAATSGCLILALSQEAQRLLGQQLAGPGASRRYRCIVIGGPRQDQDVLRARLGRGADGRRATVGADRPGKDAVTHFSVLQRGEQMSELECWLETGRTHQIRIQLAAIGCPVLGDAVYGPRPLPKGLPRVPRLMLHAHRIDFDHPIGGERVSVTAPMPSLFEHMGRRL